MADLSQLNELHQFNEFRDKFPPSTAPRLLRDRLKPLETWSERFRRRYRLRKRTVVLLTDLLRRSLEPETVTCDAVPPLLQVLCALRYFAKGSYQDEVADIHCISQPTQSRIVRKVSQALCERRTQSVHFPTSQQKHRETARVFFERFGFRGVVRGVVGAIDGTHISIKSLGGNKQALYICRQKFHPLNVQVTKPTESGLSAIHDRRFFISADVRSRREDHKCRCAVAGQRAGQPYLGGV
ncbi:hypothetical protein HPB48_011657 [Haemaphysalis longicornis]|uniref:Nuclease HARBI1 n=1 Tax=Haemaphysalis longicornis TaxID=44386 RepID=A0A9J6GAW0_HAELO|nr:hypothetical protein HPB48_011657 [Haemaphysalis longicornis]